MMSEVCPVYIVETIGNKERDWENWVEPESRERKEGWAEQQEVNTNTRGFNNQTHKSDQETYLAPVLEG
jgi:hypothetical protein